MKKNTLHRSTSSVVTSEKHNRLSLTQAKLRNPLFRAETWSLPWKEETIWAIWVLILGLMILGWQYLKKTPLFLTPLKALRNRVIDPQDRPIENHRLMRGVRSIVRIILLLIRSIMLEPLDQIKLKNSLFRRYQIQSLILSVGLERNLLNLALIILLKLKKVR